MIGQGSRFGYLVNETKSWLIIKDPQRRQRAEQLFEFSAIQLTTNGKRHLGAAIGSNDFRIQYTQEKITKWQSEVERLAEFAKTEPQAAYAAYTHGEKHKFGYFMRTIPGMSEYFEPLDRVIRDKLLPALTGQLSISDSERKLFALPARDGGLTIPVLSEISEDEFQTSMRMTAPLATLMVLQSSDMPNPDDISASRNIVNAEKRTREREK